MPRPARVISKTIATPPKPFEADWFKGRFAARSAPLRPCSPAAQRGLSLIEVMVALLVVALALLAASQAGRASILAAERQRDLTLAQLCANNALAQLRLAAPWPQVGVQTQSCRQSGHDFSLVLTTAATPNPSLRRVQVEVFAPPSELASQGGDEHNGPRIIALVTLAGRY